MEPDKPQVVENISGTKDVVIGKPVIHQIYIRTATAATLPTLGFVDQD
jgi:hypothetical protein